MQMVEGDPMVMLGLALKPHQKQASTMLFDHLK